MFAKVIPLTKLPRKFDHFDYSVPEKLKNKIKEGHLVVVYFRNRKTIAVIKELMKNTKFNSTKIKPINSLIDEILPKTLIDVIEFASNFYLASSAIFYKAIIPILERKTSIKEKILYPPKSLSLTKQEVENIISILKNYKDNKSFFLYDNNFKETLSVFIKLAEKNLKYNKQTLLLVPTLKDIEKIAPYLINQFKEKLVVWRVKDNKTTKRANWLKILSGDPYIILGTRPASFLPYKNLKTIMIYNSTSQEHKQWDMNPRYGAKKILAFTAKKTGADFILTDVWPSLNTFKKISEKQVLELNKPVREKELIISDIRQEKGIKSHLLTFPVYEMIKDAHNQNKRVILLINRGEKDKIFICNDCNSIINCPKCNKAYAIDKERFFCYNCGTGEGMAEVCPKCKSSKINTLQGSIKTIKKNIERELGIEVHSISKDHPDFTPNFRILLTTDYFWKNILYKLTKEDIYGAAILDFDFYLGRVEFNQKEIAILALQRFLNFSQNFDLEKTIIQTAMPENTIFQNINHSYIQELKERKTADYPPFSKLIKIICKNESEQKLESDVNKLYNKLKESNYNPMPPFTPYIKKRTKNYLKYIILKEKLDKNLIKLKEIIPDKYQIDVNPISIY